jgi:hypothetical protein
MSTIGALVSLFRRKANSTLRGTFFRAVLFSLVLVPFQLLAGEGGGKVVIVADSRRFTGWKAWWTNLYNESHLGFALVTIVIVPVIGLILGKVTGWLLARTGVNLKSRELAEH